nr:MAG TPA: hypothetical protein [Caudoviricetes sp.]
MFLLCCQCGGVKTLIFQHCNLQHLIFSRG